MKRPTFFHFLFSGLIVFSLSIGLVALAGSLTPSASPASTMNSLEDIYNAVAGTFDSTSITANQSGSLLQLLRYLNNNLGFASSSTNLYSLNSGNVGIGTSTPSAKLHVVGSFIVTGTTSLGTTTAGTWNGNTISTAYGGTGATSFTSNGVLYGSSTAAVQVTAAGTAGQFLIANSAAVPTFITLSGDATLASTGVLTFATTNANLTNLTTIQSLDRSGTITIGTTSATTITIGRSGQLVTLPGNLTVTGTTTLSANLIQTGGTISLGTTTQSGLLHVATNTISSLVIANSGNVGIGTTSPGSLFAVAGNAYITGNATATTLNIISTTTFNGVGYGWPSADGSSGQVLSTNGSKVLSWTTVAAGSAPVSLSQLLAATTSNTLANANNTQTWNWNLASSSQIALRLSENATSSTATSTATLLQIDTLAGSQVLPLLVKSQATEVFRIASSTTQILAANGTAAAPLYSFLNTTNTGLYSPAVGAIGATVSGSEILRFSSSTFLALGTTTPVAGLLHVATNTTNALFVANSGRVGIGTTTPAEQLSITGNLQLPVTASSSGSTVGIVNLSTSSFIHAFGTSNFFAGVKAGNFTLTGSENVGVGSSAFANLTSGTRSVSIGYQALTANTTGSNNAALGYTALSANTTGSQNTALGYQALASNITGSNNTTLGYNSLLSTTGGNNTAIGANTGGNITTGTNNLFLGYLADSGSNTLSNAAAIGANAIVNISNAVVLGGTGANAINVGIGTTTPIGYLHIATSSQTVLISTSTNFLTIGTSTITAGLLHVATSATTSLFVANSGNVGINTTTPGSALTVTGNVLFSSSVLTLGGTGDLIRIFSTTSSGASNNLFIGNGAGNFTMGGTSNNAVGKNALNANTDGNRNNAFGASSLQANTTGSDNNAFGFQSLTANTIGGNNNAFGGGALKDNTTGSANNAFGYQALQTSTSSNNNSAFGNTALKANTSGGNNSAFGQASLEANTSGSNNSAFGVNSLRLQTTGESNSALGVDTLKILTTGSQNSAIGRLAGQTITTGSNNLFLGYLADAGSNNLSNAIAIGANAVVNLSNAMVLGSGVNVGIGTSTPVGFLHIATGTTNLLLSTSTTFLAIGTSTPVAGLLHIATNTISSLVVLNSGNVGINTTTAAANLTVNGTLLVTSTTTFNSIGYKWPSADGSSGQILSTNGSGGLSWATDSSGGSGAPTSLSALIAATTSNTIANATATQTWQWTLSTQGGTGFRLTEAATSTATSTTLVQIDTLTNSNAIPLHIKAITNTALFVATSGTVAIGTSTPVAGLLHVANGTSSPLFISNGTNVGIGTTNPTAKLEIGSGQIFLPLGAVGAPSYSFTGDSNTGIFSSGADVLNLVTGGTEAFRISGGSTPQILAASGSASAPTYSFSSDSNSGIYSLTDDTLAVAVAGVRNMRIDGGGILYLDRAVGDTSSYQLSVQKARGSIASPSAITSGDDLFKLSSLGYVGGNNAHVEAARILFTSTGTIADTATGTAGIITFSTRASSGLGSLIERLRINDNGDIGIGTTTPNARLSVSGTFTATGTASFGGALLQVGGNARFGTSTAFGIFNIATNTINSFIVDNSGNVGIGTTSPGSLFSVAGNTYITGNATATSLMITGTVAFGTTTPTASVFQVATSATTSLFVANSGRVGIGTTTPNTLFSVGGAISTAFRTVTGDTTMTATSSVVSIDATGGNITINLQTAVGVAGRRYTFKRIDGSPNTVTVDPAGSETIDGGTTQSLSLNDGAEIVSDGANWIMVSEANAGFDLAENFPTKDTTLEFGDLVMLDTVNIEHVTKASAISSRVIGVVSHRPGLLLGKRLASSTPVALAGRVPVKVTGEVAIGDPLVLSDIAGVAKKQNRSGMVIGYALESHSGSEVGRVSAFISLGYHKLDLNDPINPEWLISSDNRLTPTTDLDLNLHNLLNVKAISAANGKWSISEDGRIVAEEIEAQRIKVQDKIIIKDKIKGIDYCVTIEDGDFVKRPCDAAP